MFGWLFLFIAQAMLIGRGNFQLHRMLGLASIPFFVALMASAILLSVNGLLKPLPPPVERLIDNIFFLQIWAIVLTPVFYWLAITARRNNPEHHKRYMLLLTFFLIEAAASRMTYLPGMDSNATFLVAQYFYLDLLLLPLFIFDIRTLGRVSQATLIGVSILLTYQVIAMLVWDSAWWLNTVNVIEAWFGGVLHGAP